MFTMLETKHSQLPRKRLINGHTFIENYLILIIVHFQPSQSALSILYLSVYMPFLYYNYVFMYVCKVICPKAGLSLDMQYQGSAYLSLLDKREE